MNTGTVLAQKIDTTNDQQLFEKGIYLENLKILLPWDINFTDFTKIGNPTYTKDPYHRGQIFIKWDSIIILTGIKMNLKVQKLKKVLIEDKSFPINVYNFTTDSNGVKKLEYYFFKYTGKAGTIIKGRKYQYTRWVINDCFVTTGVDKSDKYFLWVSKMY